MCITEALCVNESPFNAEVKVACGNGDSSLFSSLGLNLAPTGKNLVLCYLPYILGKVPVV